ncbi:hypothetical protein AGLY_006873 [Aphis glycines]|uniref:Uncharacterized protein n=1 Tax=Aphis glycines TaxID=307491 RepID=A0A6G0TQ25_APHGL|nr:hypothetical protein AGLY_006873 [Aphis glycines]
MCVNVIARSILLNINGNTVPLKNLRRIQKPTIKCKSGNTHTPHSTHDSLFQSSFQSSTAPKEKIDPFTSNNTNNCLNDQLDFGVQLLLSETQDVGIQCEIDFQCKELMLVHSVVNGDDLNEVENLKQHLLDLHLKFKKEKELNLELQNTIKLQKEIINSIPNNKLKENYHLAMIHTMYVLLIVYDHIKIIKYFVTNCPILN